MNGPWFEANQWGWLPGTLFGCLGGLWGALVSRLAPQGKARRCVLGAGVMFAGISAGFLAAGLAAWFAGQPHGVWYAFLLPGVQGSILFPLLLPLVRRSYREAERRKIQAEDL